MKTDKNLSILKDDSGLKSCWRSFYNDNAYRSVQEKELYSSGFDSGYYYYHRPISVYQSENNSDYNHDIQELY